MTDQDQVNEKFVCLIIKGGRLTAQTLALAMRLFVRGSKRIHKAATTHHGKQTVKHLTKQGAVLESIEVKDENIKAFTGVARKYGIDFAPKLDCSEHPPRYLVFFKSRDAAAMDMAFNEYYSCELKKSKQKPSIMQTMQRNAEKSQNRVQERTRHKDRGLER